MPSSRPPSILRGRRRNSCCDEPIDLPLRDGLRLHAEERSPTVSLTTTRAACRQPAGISLPRWPICCSTFMPYGRHSVHQPAITLDQPWRARNQQWVGRAPHGKRLDDAQAHAATRTCHVVLDQSIADGAAAEARAVRRADDSVAHRQGSHRDRLKYPLQVHCFRPVVLRSGSSMLPQIRASRGAGLSLSRLIWQRGASTLGILFTQTECRHVT